MTFIDLFAGLGGFHKALAELGHDCVFASEKKEALANLYKKNFDIEVNKDIRSLEPKDIPSHDILCAGFPCQPFSKAGKQMGLKDKTNGSFFDIIVNILDYHQPKYFVLENVRNLESHNGFKTWNYISVRLEAIGYTIDKKVLSPHHFNIPQHRERLFIIGSLEGLEHFEWPKKIALRNTARNFIHTPNNPRKLSNEKEEVIKVWQEFIGAFSKEDKLPGFPIWSMEFGATYPFEKQTPYSSSSNLLGRKKGSFGVSLKGMSREEKINNIPSYAKTSQETFPDWKIRYIRKNREFYKKYKTIIDPTLEKIKTFQNSSWQKLEWNCGDSKRDLSNYIIQFRASGVRIKKTDFFPSLVTVSTQVPIIAWENRYISPEEGASIQCLEGLKLPNNIGSSFGALGNAVNSKIVKLIAENLIEIDEIDKKSATLNQTVLSIKSDK